MTRYETIKVQQKIKQNNLKQTKADKRTTTVILHKNEYITKAETYIMQNNYKKPN